MATLFIGKEYRNFSVRAIAYLFVLLFVYAAISKLLDFETFTVQLAQSPLLSAYATFVSWAVPIMELFISLLLTLPKYRILGLFASFTLMVMFTAYIYIILNFSDFVPCSCGGVLEKLSWTQHLIFNVFFILLAGVAVFFTVRKNVKKTLLMFTTLAIFGIGTVTLLFAFSEKKMHRNNAFQRRYPHQQAYKVNQLDIKYNSYYFAGITSDSIYFGNTTAPAHILSIDLRSYDSVHRSIQLDDEGVSLRSLKTIVADTVFYSWDGSIPVIFKGKTENFRATKSFTNGIPFLRAEYVAEDKFTVRVFDNTTTKNVLGKLSLNDSILPDLYPNLLSGNSDPFFDTDGLLLYNPQLQKVIYVYFYRNEFVVVDHNFSLDYIGKTIDTISHSQLDIHNISSKQHRKIGKNPIFVNLRAATYGNYLFIQSDRLGKFEPEEVIKSAFIIDVYNLIDNTYVFSFYLYYQGNSKLNEFIIEGNKLFALVNNYLITYKLEETEFFDSQE